MAKWSVLSRAGGRWAGAVSIAGALFASLSASAFESRGDLAAPGWTLDWQAPAECPAESALTGELERLLGEVPQRLGSIRRVTARVRIQGESLALSLVFEEPGRRSVRVIEGSTCDDLVEAGALAIALAREQSSGAEDAPASEGPPPSQADEAHLVGTVEPSLRAIGPALAEPDAADSSPVSKGDRADWLASVETLVDVGSLPRTTLALSLGARVRLGRFRIGGHALLARSQRQSVGPGQFIEFGMELLGARACAALVESAGRPGALGLSGCASFEGGRQTLEGLGLRDAQVLRRLWLAPGAGLEGTLGLSSLAMLSVRAESMVPVGRRRAVVDNSTLVHRPALVVVRGYLGVALRFD